eukprot:XP_011672451.1 PREDICTED: uncharacterized protein LOC105442229 [Strongylocentrotus purpuratus]
MAGNRWLFAGVVLVTALCRCTVALPVPQLQTGDFDSKELTNDIFDQEQAHDLAVIQGIEDETDENYIDMAYGYDDDEDEINYGDFANDAQDDDVDDMITRLFQLRGSGGRGKGRGKGRGRILRPLFFSG